MKKCDLLYLTLNNSESDKRDKAIIRIKQKMFKTMIRETRRLLGSNKKCSKQGEFKLSM